MEGENQRRLDWMTRHSVGWRARNSRGKESRIEHRKGYDCRLRIAIEVVNLDEKQKDKI